MEYEIRLADEKDLPGIVRLMNMASVNPEHPDWFVPDDEAYIREHLAEKGYICVAVTEDHEIAGFFMVKYTDPDDPKHLGRFLNYSREQLEQTAVMDSAVVDRRFRGNKLQSRMAGFVEEHLDKSRWPYRLCTVHPDNIYSLSNMQANGYEIRAKVLCYGGKTRYILGKQEGERV